MLKNNSKLKDELEAKVRKYYEIDSNKIDKKEKVEN